MASVAKDYSAVDWDTVEPIPLDTLVSLPTVEVPVVLWVSGVEGRLPDLVAVLERCPHVRALSTRDNIYTLYNRIGVKGAASLAGGF